MCGALHLRKIPSPILKQIELVTIMNFVMATTFGVLHHRII